MILRSFNKNHNTIKCLNKNNFSTNTTNQNNHTTKEIREKFLNYFENNKHKRLASSSLIPHNDNTLLFTNAGMVQFKNQFTGLEESKFKLVTTSQKCVRAGGKHNDLENVGYTARHHTFFEMLGNFSFGGYSHFKRDSIQHAWDLLTKEFGLPKERLAISVLEGDEESASIWRDQIGLPNDRIMYKGKEDNFWSMGDGPGPCGPCSEIFWDQQQEVDGERWLEIWNLVFMQYNRTDKGELERLAMPCVDTGMGLERMATVLQGKLTNYDIDLFQNLINQFKNQVLSNPKSVSHISKQDPIKIEAAYRVIVDHLRSISFLISDGVIPFNIGRGYVLRKIIRRALSYGRLLGFDAPFLHQLFTILENEMSDQYPQLTERSNEIKNVIHNEEITFYRAIKRGIPYLEDMIEKNQLNEDNLFLLYNTYGLPLEISEVKAKQNNIPIDMNLVSKLIEKNKNDSKLVLKSESNTGESPSEILNEIKKWKNENILPEFIGYESIQSNDCKILKSYFDNDNHQVYLSFDKSVFYGKSGGQIGDIGIIQSNKSPQNQYQVIDTIKPYDGSLVVLVEWDPTKHLLDDIINDLSEGSVVTCRVEKNIRKQTAIHHSATHLLHSALREIIGKSVVQAGSYVGPNILRFDFTHNKKLSNDEIERIEQWVNNVIDQDIQLEVNEMSYQDASKSDAIQLFSEKYQDQVRVVSIPGYSKELCGGTHVERSSDIHHFKIISESSVAAGTRRIEAVAGKAATQYFKSHYSLVNQLSQQNNIQLPNFQQSIEKLFQQSKQNEKEINELMYKIALLSTSTHHGHICGVECGSGIDHPLSIHVVDHCNDIKTLNNIASNYSKSNPDNINLILSKQNGKAICNLGSNQNHNTLKTNADIIVKKLLSSIGTGKGGGSKVLANATIPLFDDNTLSLILKWGNCNNNNSNNNNNNNNNNLEKKI